MLEASSFITRVKTNSNRAALGKILFLFILALSIMPSQAYDPPSNGTHLEQTLGKHYATGVRLLDQKKYLPAYEEFVAAIKENPTEAKFYISRASALNELKRYVECLSDIDQVLELHKQKNLNRAFLANAYLLRGLAYRGLGKLSHAEKALEMAVQVFSLYSYAHLYLGEVYAEEGKTEAARKELEIAKDDIKNVPDDSDYAKEVLDELSKLQSKQ